MICNDKISVRAKSEDKAISIAYELLKEEMAKLNKSIIQNTDKRKSKKK